MKFWLKFLQIHNFVQENAFEYFICETATNLFRPQWVNIHIDVGFF